MRFAYLNDPNTIGLGYFTGWETGLVYFDGGGIDWFYEETKKEIEARAKGETIHYGPDRFVKDCHIPVNE